MEISILVLTYNHEKYIRQALDSILSQQIDVPYEILILDDASSDSTPQILREYKKRYHQRITLYLKKRNSCHPTKNAYFLMSQAKGKYIAWIDGDDFWIDALKIQKQYLFLEKWKKYSACVTDVEVVDENNNEIPNISFYEKKADQIYTIEDFRAIKTAGMTASLFARNYFGSQDYTILYRASSVMGDITSFMLCALNGPIYQMEEKTAAYRYASFTGGNNFNSIHKDNIYKDYMIVEYWIRLENYMKKYYNKDFEIIPIKESLARLAARYSVQAMMHLIFQSKNYRKYIVYYIAHEYLLDSEFIKEDGNVNIKFHKERWKSYIKDKRPVVLFGAGEVAKEYIDKFAWQGNILFLVDNDIRKQNKSYKGFLIKNPEEILKYKNIKILITSKEHENEIECQLQGIGKKDYYCYCSMQSNRIKNAVANRIFKRYEGKQDGRNRLKV